MICTHIFFIYIFYASKVTVASQVGTVHVQASYCQNRIAASLGGNIPLSM